MIFNAMNAKICFKIVLHNVRKGVSLSKVEMFKTYFLFVKCFL